MKVAGKNILSLVLTMALLIAMCPTALLAGNQRGTAQIDKNHITFSGLAQLEPGDFIQCEVETDRGPAVVGIARVRGHSRAGGETWRVWYNGIIASVEFYMDVANNKVTSVYDDSISIFGGTYEDAALTKTSTYGKLTFTYKSIGGITASTCWLKGTVTGTNDEIDVTWKM